MRSRSKYGLRYLREKEILNRPNKMLVMVSRYGTLFFRNTLFLKLLLFLLTFGVGGLHAEHLTPEDKDKLLYGDTTCPYGAQFCNRCVQDADLALHLFTPGISSSISYSANKDEILPPHRTRFPGMKCRLSIRDFPGHCDHIQGLARIPGVGDENWVVGTVAHPLIGNGHGGFFLANLVDIEGHGGESFRYIESSPLRPASREVKFWYPMSNTDHAGGMQMLGRTLVVSAHCARSSGCSGYAFVDFYDLTQPIDAVHTQRFILDGTQGEPQQYPPNSSHNGRATAPAIVRLQDGRYLLFVLGGGSNDGWLYVSDTDTITSTTRWHYVQRWTQAHVLPDADAWIPSTENVNFITDCASGDIYLVALGNKGFFPPPALRSSAGTQIVGMYKLVQRSADFVSGPFRRLADGPAIRFDFINRIKLNEEWCTLRAGGSVHVTPQGDMVFYCSTYQAVPGDNLVVEEWSLANYLFYEGNRCTQDLVGTMPSADVQLASWNLKKNNQFKNDEARSVFIQRATTGQILRVADEPKGEVWGSPHRRKDDWAEITVLQDIGVKNGYCIESFEESYQDAFVRLTYYADNGLDGKISHIQNDENPNVYDRLLPLFNGWRWQDADNRLSSNQALVSEVGTEADGYRWFRREGFIYNPLLPQPANTRALYTWYSSNSREYYTTTHPAWVPNGQEDTHSNYTFVRKEGYVPHSQLSGTRPLRSWWRPDRQDNFATTNPEWNKPLQTTNGGYTHYRVEGYIFSHPPRQIRPTQAAEPARGSSRARLPTIQ